MIPARYTPIVFSAVMATMMAFLMTFAVTLLNTGFDAGFVGRWLHAFMVVAPLAFGAVLVVAPVARRLTAALTA